MGSLAEPASDLPNVRDDEEATNARPISSTTRSGVPSGTAIPPKTGTVTSYPSSSAVGTFGRSGQRPSESTASAFDSPAKTSESTTASSGTSAASTSAS